MAIMKEELLDCGGWPSLARRRWFRPVSSWVSCLWSMGTPAAASPPGQISLRRRYTAHFCT
jgi:hypothetical protein